MEYRLSVVLFLARIPASTRAFLEAICRAAATQFAGT